MDTEIDITVASLQSKIKRLDGNPDAQSVGGTVVDQLQKYQKMRPEDRHPLIPRRIAMTIARFFAIAVNPKS